MRLQTPLLVIAALLSLPACSERLVPAPLPMVAPGGPWISAHYRQHDLVGRVWDTARGAYTTPEAVVAALAEAPFVLLGEKHDNPDHHRLQAWLMASLAERGRRPAVAFEMLDTDQEEALSRHLADHPRDAAGLGPAVAWEKTGWPDWVMYQPIAQAALDARLPIVAASLPRAVFRKMAAEGVGALPADQRAALGLDRPIPDEQDDALREEIMVSHCDQLPESMVDPMVLVQKVKDVRMASVMAKSAGPKGTDGAVLIAGNGHVRADRGVPWQLRRLAPGRAAATVAMVEVAEEVMDPEDYAAGFGTARLPFDFVWFTPRVDIDDPCEKFAEQFRHVRARKAKEKDE